MSDRPAIAAGWLGGLSLRAQVGGVYGLDAPVGVSVLDPFAPVRRASLARTPPAPLAGVARVADGPFATLGDQWFEIVHVFPRRLDLGNVLSFVDEDIEVYNAFRDQAQSWSAVDVGLGSGAELVGSVPPPPVSLPPLSGVVLSLEVQPVGPPFIDGVILFTFAGLYETPVPVTASRLVAFPFQPEQGVREYLRWLTDVLDVKSGREQRVALRAFPRQEFRLEFVLDEGPELTAFDNVVGDWQALVFGLPVWTESAFMTSAVAPGDLVLPISTSAWADYRVGGLAMVWSDRRAQEVVVVSGVSAGELSLGSPVLSAYPRGAVVMPVRLARLGPEVQGSRFRVGAGRRAALFRVVDNVVGSGFPDLSAFPTYDGDPLFDDPNAIPGGTLREGLVRRLVDFDSGSGAFSAQTTWGVGKRASAKGFRPKNPEALWRVRRALHALRGRHRAFWLPTFYRDLRVVETVQGGTGALIVEDVGFTQFVGGSRPNRSVIRLESVSGASQVREVVSASVLSGNRESLSVSPAWSAGNIAPSDVRRVTFFERVRLASDDVEIVHGSLAGQAEITLGVITVLDP